MLLNHFMCGCRRNLLNLRVPANIQLALKNVKQPTSEFNAIKNVRNYSSRNIVNYERKELHWITKDNIQGNYKLIYNAVMHRYIVYSSASCLFSLVAVAFGVFTYYYKDLDRNEEIKVSDYLYASNMGEITSLAVIVSIICFGLFVATRRYVFRIYRGPEDFIAIYAGAVPGTYTKRFFKPGTVKAVEFRWEVLPWSTSLFTVDGKKSILLESRFKTSNDLYVMMYGERRL